MLLACIAVCMSNMSFSLHGFSVHVSCQTHSSSQPSLILCPQSNRFNVLNPPPPCFTYFSPHLFLAFFLIPADLSLLPPFNLVHKAFEWCFLCSVPLSGRIRGLGSLPVDERGTVRGCQYTNTKQYPIVHPPFCFLQWEASSTKDITWIWGPEWSFDRAGKKLTDVIPIWNNCEHLQCWNK